MDTTLQIHCRHISISKLFVLLLFCALSIQRIWAQDIELLPTGRSLPDTIPSDQIIYLGPFGDVSQSTPPDSDPSPLSSPTEPITEIERLDTIEEEGIAIIDEFGTIESPEAVDIDVPKFGPPIEPKNAPVESRQAAVHTQPLSPSSIPAIPPRSPIAAEKQSVPLSQTKIRGAAPNSAAPIPPDAFLKDIESGTEVLIPPDIFLYEDTTDTLAEKPLLEFAEPDSEPVIPPNASITDEDALLDFSPYMNEPQSGISPEEYIDSSPTLEWDTPPHNTPPSTPDLAIHEQPQKNKIEDDIAQKQQGLPEEWVYTLTPTENQFPPEDTKEKPKEEEKSISVPPPTPTPTTMADTTPPISSALVPGHYVQVASYTNEKAALDESTQLLAQKNVREHQKQKIVLYKVGNSNNYRLLIGPFPKTEVGVEVYSVRNYGYRNAYAISE